MKIELEIPDDIAPEIALQAASQAVKAGESERFFRDAEAKRRAGVRVAFWRKMAAQIGQKE